MKKQRLVKYLGEHGCYLDREGGRHEYWRSADGERGAAVPRQREIQTATMKSICRDLDIPVPNEK